MFFFLNLAFCIFQCYVHPLSSALDESFDGVYIFINFTLLACNMDRLIFLLFFSVNFSARFIAWFYDTTLLKTRVKLIGGYLSVVIIAKQTNSHTQRHTHMFRIGEKLANVLCHVILDLTQPLHPHYYLNLCCLNDTECRQNHYCF